MSIQVDDGLLTAAEAAAFLKVPVATLYSWRQRGIGPRAIRVGKYLRYRRAAILDWLDELEAA
jgi:predicted DNA-binding transcriptional regulator AlpA